MVLLPLKEMAPILPKVPVCCPLYVEPMDVKDSQIKMFARDLTERPIQADVEKPVDPLAPEMDSIPEAENKIGSDLPF